MEHTHTIQDRRPEEGGSMLKYEDQMELLRLISEKITKDVDVYAFGGNAMMFYGYKDDTKDVDLLFKSYSSRKEFIEALKVMGYVEKTPLDMYIPEKQRDKSKPMMYRMGDFRFDLFAKQIFRTRLSDAMKESIFAVHDFQSANRLRVKVLSKEHIVFLKAITDRQNDIEDIKTILRLDKYFNWQVVVDEAIWQHRHGDSWALLDLEKAMQEIKVEHFIPKKYFDQIYKEKL